MLNKSSHPKNLLSSLVSSQKSSRMESQIGFGVWCSGMDFSDSLVWQDRNQTQEKIAILSFSVISFDFR